MSETMTHKPETDRALSERDRLIAEVLRTDKTLVESITQYVCAHMEYGSDIGLDGSIALAIAHDRLEREQERQK